MVPRIEMLRAGIEPERAQLQVHVIPGAQIEEDHERERREVEDVIGPAEPYV